MKFTMDVKAIVAAVVLVLVGASIAIGVGVSMWLGKPGPTPGVTYQIIIIGEPVSIDLPAQEATTVTHESGARIEIPEGATREQSTVSIAEVEPPASSLEVRRAFDFSVGGAELLKPVTIHIPFELGQGEDVSDIYALHWDEEVAGWKPVPGVVDESAQTIAVITSDLSLFSWAWVKVDASCDVNPGIVEVGESFTVTATGTSLTSGNIKLYMKPEIKGPFDLPDKPDAKSEIAIVGKGEEFQLEFTDALEVPAEHLVRCRIFWETIGPHVELESAEPPFTFITVEGEAPVDLAVAVPSTLASRSIGPAIAGQEVTVRFDVGNYGYGPSGPFDISFYLSRSEGDTDIIVGEPSDFPSYEAGDVLNQRAREVQIPEDLTPGPYWLCGQIRAKSSVMDLNEDNNTSCGKTYVLPDMSGDFDEPILPVPFEQPDSYIEMVQNSNSTMHIPFVDEFPPDYWVFIPSALASIEVADGVADHTIDRRKLYRQLALEIMRRPEVLNRVSGDSISSLVESAGVGGTLTGMRFNKDAIGELATLPDVAGVVAEVYESGGSGQGASTGLAWLGFCIEVWEFGTVWGDIQIAAGMYRHIQVEEAQRTLNLLSALDLQPSAEWNAAIRDAQQELDEMTSDDEWRKFFASIREHEEELTDAYIDLAVAGGVLAGKIAAGVVLGKFAVVTAPIWIGVAVAVDTIHETDAFWDNLSIATGLAQVYERLYSLDIENQGLGIPEPDSLRLEVLAYTKFKFYHYLHEAADNRALRGRLIGNVGTNTLDQHIEHIAGERDDALEEAVDAVRLATIELGQSSISLMSGQALQLEQPVLRSGSGRILTDYDVEWLSSNPFVAKVSSSGEVTGGISGEAVISVRGHVRDEFIFDPEDFPPGARVYTSSFPVPESHQQAGTITTQSTTITFSYAIVPIYVTAEVAVTVRESTTDATDEFPAVSDRDALIALYNATDGPNWENTDDLPWLTEDSDSAVGGWHGVTVHPDYADRVWILTLRWNCLRGELPSSIRNLTLLNSLFLAQNKPPDSDNPSACGNLEGPIPASLGNLTNLQMLYLSDNNLSGAIPSELGSPQSKLEELYLANNRLSGEIPASLGDLRNLYALDLRNNQLEGQIPEKLAELPNLEELYLSGGGNEFTGCIPATLFDIEDNDLDELGLEACEGSGRTTEVGTSVLPSTTPPGASTPFDRDASGDFTGLAAAGNTDPEGIWSDGTTMWVADWSDNKLYAYNMTTKARDAAKHFDTLAAAGITNPTGIWSDGTTMWVTDWSDNKLYAYNLTTKARDAAKDFNTLDAAGNTAPEGLWSDGTTMWVADRDDDKLYAYNMTTKARDAAKDFDTLDAAGNEHPYGSGLTARPCDFNTLDAAGNTAPEGLWSDGTTMWVADRDDDKLYAYNMTTKARDAAKDFDTLDAAGNEHPYGVWSDGTTMWVADRDDNKIYAYNLTTKARDAAKDFNTLVAAGNTYPTGIWSDGTTMWVADTPDDKIYAYNMPSAPGVSIQPPKPVVETPAFDRDASGDFTGLAAAGNTDPEGIWSDGTTMWVADWSDNKLYAYNMTTKARDAAKHFDTLAAAGITNPTGIWSDGTTMWVTDWSDNKLYAYNLTTKARDAAKDFNTLDAAGNTAPEGLWSDGTTMWVADRDDDKLYAYNMTTKARDAAKDFDTLDAAGNEHPYGVWSDGTTMWVADRDDNKIYAYNLTTKARDAAKDFNTLVAAGNTYPTGIWSDGTTMWVADTPDDKIYAYNMPSALGVSIQPPKPVVETPAFDRDASGDFTGLAAAGNTDPEGIWSDGTTMWVADWSDNKLYAYNMTTKARDAAKHFDTLAAAGITNPTGIWSDGTTMWVTDWSDNKLYAYNLTTKARDAAKDFNTLDAAGNTAPEGLWSDGTTMWVADRDDDKLYAYNMTTKARDAAKDFDTLDAAGNEHPYGVWSDGTTMWVADRDDNKIYAYNLTTKARDAAKDFNTLVAAGNTYPTGIWSDGTTMWVADTPDDKIYAYNMPSALGVSIQPPKPVVETPAFDRDASGDFTGLAAAGNTDPEGIWSDGTTMWVADWSDNKLYAYNMTTKARDAAKHFDTLAAAGITNPTGIWSDGTTMWVTDWSDNKLYAYNLTTKARDAAKDFNTLDAAGNTAPEGLWSDGTTMWVADRDDDKLYAYNMTTKARDAAKDFDTLDAAGNEHPYGVWSDGTTMWVADRDDNKIYAYNLTTKARDAAKDFNTLVAAGNTYPTGIWSDGTTMWVADTPDDKIYAYNMPSALGVSIRPPKPVVETPAFDRDASGDFTGLAAAGNTDPEGIWSDGTTMWLSNWSIGKIYAYDMVTKARLQDKEFDLLKDVGESDPVGIWSDGAVLWIAARTPAKIYAFDINTFARLPGMEFNTLESAGNNHANGIWSDGETMWVSDTLDNKLYAYNMPPGSPGSPKR